MTSAHGGRPAWRPEVEARLDALAREQARTVAVVDAEGSITYAALRRVAGALARRLVARGVTAGAVVPVTARPDRGFYAEVVAAWTLGAAPLPLPASDRYALAGSERGRGRGGDAGPACRPWKAVLSAAWGRRAPVVTHGEAPTVARKASALGLSAGGVALIASPLHLNGPFEWSARQLLLGGTIVLAPRFDPATYLAAARRQRPTWAFLVPLQMHRLLDTAGDTGLGTALGSLELLLHSSQPCPPTLRRRYAGLLGDDRLAEYYGTAEYDGALARPSGGGADGGFRGYPIPGVRFRAVGLDGRALPAGVDGLLQARTTSGLVTHTLGSPCPPAGTWSGIGDRGHVDPSGRLALTSVTVPGRAIVGGINVALTRVRQVVLAHGGIEGCQVAVAPHSGYGEVVTVQARTRDPRLTAAALHRHCATHLGPGERPHTIRIVRTRPAGGQQ